MGKFFKTAEDFNLHDLYSSDKIKFNKYLEADREIIKSRELAKLDALKSFKYKNLAVIGGSIIGVTLLADQIIDWLKNKATEHKTQEYYVKMLEAHPQLKKEDPKTVAKYWESLNHFAPHVAKDPLASGSYITQSIKRLSGEQLGGPPPDTFNTLADIQKKYQDSSDRTPLKSFKEDLAKKIIQTGMLI